MILIARKHPKKHFYKEFDAYRILNINSDFDWFHENSKCDWVRRFITDFPDATKKQIKYTFNYHIDKVCFYEEFLDKAKSIIKMYKKRGAE